MSSVCVVFVTTLSGHPYEGGNHIQLCTLLAESAHKNITSSFSSGLKPCSVCCSFFALSGRHLYITIINIFVKCYSIPLFARSEVKRSFLRQTKDFFVAQYFPSIFSSGVTQMSKKKCKPIGLMFNKSGDPKSVARMLADFELLTQAQV